MADIRINPEKLETLLRKYRPDAITRDGVGGTTEFVMRCPFHSDSNPSFHLNLHKGVGHCFSCPTKKNYTLEETIAELEGKNTRQASSLLRQEGVYEKAKKEEKPPALTKEQRQEGCGIRDEQLVAWQETLIQDAKAMALLVKATGWTMETIKRFRIGWTGDKYSIPMFANNVLVNVKYYAPNGKPKYSGEKDSNSVRLWPLDNINRPGSLWLMEGEKDCILANQCGMNAVTFTGGAGAFPMEYLMAFKDKDVNIIYDIDPAGRSGAITAADFISRVASSVRVIDIPPDGLPPTGDFTDFIHHAGHKAVELLQISLMTDTFKIKDSRTKVVIPDDVVNTYLEEVIPKKQFFRRVRMRVRVVSIAEGKTYLVPKETIVTCARNLGDQCYACKLYHTEGQPLTLHMRPEFPEIMQLIDNDDNKQKAAIKSMLEIYPKCPKVQYEFKSFQAFYPIVLIPALEKDKANHIYTMQIAWALDVPSETNVDYLAEAVIMTDPSTQALVIVCYRLDKDVTSVDSFELTDEMKEQLRIFQCQLPPTRLNES